ncbi:probable E3 SUMO-protein ligase RNF212 isoform X2 [Pimephales promelas]|uniref:probable E3 SUMO-protein ligase RNF212 isoform X2 n=1 Tax=Pimephales promelas TaxID=90988 RepID=UPI001955B559|nr:probable E3 SUMO-protein ligase RNF212 isoform X2 [Pimephales promelas]
MMDRASGMDRIMSHWICCNSCFMSPGNERQLAVTSCGHIICNVCFQRGNQGVCLICKANCQISALSDKLRGSGFFLGYQCSCSQVLLRYKQGLTIPGHTPEAITGPLSAEAQIERMKEDELKIQQEMQKMAKKISEQNAYISKLEMTVQNQSSRLAFQSNRDLPSASQRQASSVTKVPYSSPLLMSRSISSASLADSIKIDSRGLSHKTDALSRICLRSSPQNCRIASSVTKVPYSSPLLMSRSISSASLADSIKIDSRGLSHKTDALSRICLRSSPQNCHIGSVHHRASSQSSMGSHSAPFSATVREFSSGLREPAMSPSHNMAYRRESSWETPVFKLPSTYKYSSVSSLGPPL